MSFEEALRLFLTRHDNGWGWLSWHEGYCGYPQQLRRFSWRTLGGVLPVAVGFDEGDKLFDGVGLVDVALHDLAAFVEGYLACAGAHIAVVGVGHLAGSVDDAAHDADFDAFEVVGASFDLLERLLDIVLGAAAGGTGDVFALADACADGLEDVVGHGDFLDGVFGEGDEDGVADAVDEECADAGSAFVACLEGVASLGDSEVDGIVHAEFLHLLDEEARALHHDGDVTGLHGEDELVVVLLTAHLRELDGGLCHAFGGVAVARHDAFGEGAVVGADAHGCVVALADVDEARHLVANLLDLVGILLVGEMNLAGVAVGVVAGVDTHLLDNLCGDFGGLRVEVDVSHEGDVAAALGELVLDVVEVFGSTDVGGCDADNLAACFDHAEGLFDSGVGIHGVGVGHGLNADGGAAAEGEVAYKNLTAFILGSHANVEFLNVMNAVNIANEK